VIEALLERFTVDPRVATAGRRAAVRCDARNERTASRHAVSARMLAAFAAEGIADSDLAATYGYGYDDAGRARYDSLLQRVFGTESAFARLSAVRKPLRRPSKPARRPAAESLLRPDVRTIRYATPLSMRRTHS